MPFGLILVITRTLLLKYPMLFQTGELSLEKQQKRTNGFPSLRFLQINNVYDDVRSLKLSLLYLTTNAYRLQKIRFRTKERFQCDTYDYPESEMTLQEWIESVAK